MNNQPQSLISYGEKVQYGLVQKNEREMRKNATNEFDENDPISLKSYLDTILPPRSPPKKVKFICNLYHVNLPTKQMLFSYRKV